MTDTPRFLVAESETAEAREARRATAGRSSGETYIDTLHALAPGADCELIRPHETGAGARASAPLDAYDAVFLTGSPLHVYEDVPEVRRHVEFMRAVFEAGTPGFGSCAGLQVATAAAGGSVRPAPRHEVAFARRLTATGAGREHPLLRGRPPAWDALAIHSDEVERLPPDATLLARNDVTEVQAAEILSGRGVFWGVQYHPELMLAEIAAAIRRQAKSVIEQGLATGRDELDRHAALIDALGEAPARRDLAWRLGVDREVTEPERRQTELRNFIAHLVQPRRAARSRG